jgi:hypothetical protein
MEDEQKNCVYEPGTGEIAAQSDAARSLVFQPVLLLTDPSSSSSSSHNLENEK